MLPALVGPERLRSAISFNYGLCQLTGVVGPALGGIVIATLGLGWAYGIDVVDVRGDDGGGDAIAPAAAAARPEQPSRSSRSLRAGCASPAAAAS